MTTTPPWGTPTSDEGPLLPSAYSPVPRGTGAQPASGFGYALVVEQSTGSGESIVWRVAPAPLPAGPTRAAAREAALQLARTFRPNHPFSQKDRAIYRIDADTLLVLVPGMTKAFHFRISVAERLA